MLYRSIFKPVIDFSVAFIGLIILSPVLLIITLLLWAANRGNPFFFQDRPGKTGKIFRLVKFRTMNNRKDRNGKLLPDHERLTTVGRMIRSLSLDELPQLISILKGDMSLVGPRPLLVRYLPLYTPTQSRRHLVRPGITGWAQVNGRNTISWEQKFEYDVWYVDHIGFLLDIRILWMTAVKVFKREGINSAATSTMSPFLGDNEGKA
ncbi:MAG: sugar transferase [Mariniphaga sp.]|nr:sugar transferase [Mariniphaga sp.]